MHYTLRTLLLLIAAPMCAAAIERSLLAPGDIDGNGVSDLVRLADDGVVHVVNADGTGGYSFQALEAEPPDDCDWLEGDAYEYYCVPTPIRADGMSELPDSNGNGSHEIAIWGAGPYSRYDRTQREDVLDIWDPMTQTRLAQSFTEGVPTAVPDQTGDGIADLAARTNYNNGRVVVLDGLTAGAAAGISFVTTIRQILSSWHGVGILGQGDAVRRNRIEFRNLEGEITHRIWLGTGHFAFEARPVPDLNGNGSREWAVLQSGNEVPVSVIVHDDRTKARISTVHFTGDAEPLKLMVVNGTELAVVSLFHESGAQPLEVRDARTGAQHLRVWFPKTLTIESVTRTPDMNGNGSNEVAVIGEQWAGKPWSRIVTMIRDSRTGQWVRRIVWDER